MKYKFAKALTKKYSEIEQINPIRWELLYRDGDVFLPQSAKFKCKDFFNDVVAARYGNLFYIYGFNNADVKLNTDGLWVRVSYIQDYQQFSDNINNTINVFFDVNTEPHITTEDLGRGKVLLYIPSHLLSSTYKISLATYLIRLCNYGVVFSSFKEALESTAAESDKAIGAYGKQLALSYNFELPEEFSKYWYYAGKQYNSDGASMYATSTIIHNNGVLSWAQSGVK